MRSTLEELESTLDELRDFVISIDPVNNILSTHPGVVARYLTVRRRLDYAAFIVGLYSAFERFVEDLAWSYALIESTREQYASLPEKLRGKHLRESGDMLARGRLGEGRYIGVTDVDLIANLHGCLSGQHPYKLNRHAILHHDLNLRATVVDEMFAAVGIENITANARLCDTLTEFFASSKEVTLRPGMAAPAMWVELRLQDLVERRNQIAHGGGTASDSLGALEMDDLLAFMESYCVSLYSVVASTYLHRSYVASPKHSAGVGRLIEGPFDKGYVGVIAAPQHDVFIGQPVIAVVDGRVQRWGRLEEIQINGQSVTQFQAGARAPSLGLRVTFRLSKKVELYLLGRSDDVVLM